MQKSRTLQFAVGDFLFLDLALIIVRTQSTMLIYTAVYQHVVMYLFVKHSQLEDGTLVKFQK